MAFLPLYDRNPRAFITYPWVTWGLIAACILVFLQQREASAEQYLALIYGYGAIPAVLTGEALLPPEWRGPPALVTLLSYQFLHGSWMHLIGNMLFIFVFGDNVEDAMGHGRFLAFYLICGTLAALVHVMAFPGSQVPVVGASGAVSGILGAYLLLHPRAQVLVPVLIFPLFLPAWMLLILWLAFQVLGASSGKETEAIAWWAHIGGFATGMILILFFRRRTVPLFGSGRPPRGLRIRDPALWRKRPYKEKRKRGPWG